MGSGCVQAKKLWGGKEIIPTRRVALTLCQLDTPNPNTLPSDAFPRPCTLVLDLRQFKNILLRQSPPTDRSFPLERDPPFACSVNQLLLPTMPSKTLTSDDLPQLLSALPQIFNEAQQNAANHRKNLLLLRKIHSTASTVTEVRRKGGGLKLVGERAFQDAFERCLCRVLVVKKGVAVADRIVKFVAKFVGALAEQGQSGWREQEQQR